MLITGTADLDVLQGEPIKGKRQPKFRGRLFGDGLLKLIFRLFHSGCQRDELGVCPNDEFLGRLVDPRSSNYAAVSVDIAKKATAHWVVLQLRSRKWNRTRPQSNDWVLSFGTFRHGIVFCEVHMAIHALQSQDVATRWYYARIVV